MIVPPPSGARAASRCSNTGHTTTHTRVDSQMCSRISTVQAVWAKPPKSTFSSLGPPWRSHPCIESYPEWQRVRAVDLERSGRRHQPIDDAQSGLIVICICHRSAARASEKHFSSLGPPQRSHPCIEGHPECQRARGVGTGQKDCRYRSMGGRWFS